MKFQRMALHMLIRREISLIKIYNFLLNQIFYGLGITKVRGYPSILMIEPTNYCNLRCPLCPTGNNSLTAPRGFMKFEDFKKIIDETGKYLLNITLWNYGEPFLHKDIYKMVSYIRNKRIFVRISTNGHFFNKEDNIKKLIESNVDNLIISLDGASQETFSKYRKGGDFNTVINNICRITKEKKRAQKKNPFIEIQFIVMKHNEHEIEKMKKLAKTLDVDQVKIKTVNIEMDLAKEIKETMKKYLPKSEKLSRYKERKNDFERKKMKKGCKRLWFSSVINWDGSIVPCCYDPNRKHECGNAFKEGFMDVWNNEKYILFRKAVIKSKQTIEMCKKCTGDFMGLDIETD